MESTLKETMFFEQELVQWEQEAHRLSSVGS